MTCMVYLSSMQKLYGLYIFCIYDIHAGGSEFMCNRYRRFVGSRDFGTSSCDEEEAGHTSPSPMGRCKAAQHFPTGSLRLPLAGELSVQ